MNKIINKIKEDIESIKVINKVENTIDTDTSFLKVKKGNYQLNNGYTIKREEVYINKELNDAVCIFAVTTDNKIIIITTPRTALPNNDKINIELPAGYIEKNENSIEAGLRELLEETGYSSNDITQVDSYYTSLGISGERIDLLLALNCFKVGEQKLDSDEFIKYELVTLEEFEFLLNNNYIMDANARIGYYRYLEYLMKEGY